jgi:hypothetical protein
MDEKELEDLGSDFAMQCAVSYSKMAWRDEEDFKALKRIIHAEFKAVIVPFLTNGVNPPMDRE